MTFSIIVLVLIFNMSLYIVSYCYSLKLIKVYLTIRFFEGFSESLVQFCLIIYSLCKFMIRIFVCLAIYILCVYICNTICILWIAIEIEYKWQVELVLICVIHVNMWWWIVTLGGVKLWTLDMVVNKYVVNTWCDITCVLSCKLYNNTIVVYLEKVFMHEVLKGKCRVPS